MKTVHWHEVYKETRLLSNPHDDTLLDLDTEVKPQLRVIADSSVTEENINLVTYCNAAENLVESLAEIAIRDKTLALTLSRFPSYCDYLIIRLEVEPVTEIISFQYYDDQDDLQTFDSSLYETWLDKHPPSVLIKASDIPTLSSERSRAVEIVYSAGEVANIKPEAKLAVLELISFWFKHREVFGKLPEKSGEGMAFWSLISLLSWRAI